MPAQGQQRGSGGGAASAMGNLISFIMVAVLILGGIYFVVYNDIRSVDDVKGIFSGTAKQISECKKNGGSASDCAKSVVGDSPENGQSGENANPELIETVPVAPANDVDDIQLSDFQYWATIDGQCDTRDIVLRDQGQGVEVDESCSPVAGEWKDSYSGAVIPDSKNVWVDHIVPLEYANEHGANSWDAEKKKRFANDVKNLTTSSETQVTKKDNSGPSAYMPENEEFKCRYAGAWVNILSEYGLSVTTEDRDVLKQTLSSCG